MVFDNITLEHKEKLLDYVVDWNTNGKHCLAAQVFNNIIHLQLTYQFKYLTLNNKINVKNINLSKNTNYRQIM